MPRKKKDFGDRISPNHCKFCNKEFEKYQKAAAHSVCCSLNPNRKITIEKMSISLSQRTHTDEMKKRISQTVKAKVENGEWHYSFSRSRTHEYNGIKFHGQWEVKYAKYLDSCNIKWRRPTEKFQYEFEEKKRYYTPDFFLIDTNEYVEIKGYATPKDYAKWKNFPLELKVISGGKLVEMGILQENEIRRIKCKLIEN
jgi:hypothetical protein